MSKGKYTVVGLGELLWDILPSGEHLGGAPSNFAYMTALLGESAIVASRVGVDGLGYGALARLGQAGLTISHVQFDASHPTGTVKVQLDDKGKAAFSIIEDVAWDFLEWATDWQELAARADCVCFGSLAQRSPQSLATIRRFLKATRPDALIIFDVNLRQPFYSTEVISESLRLSKVVKFNDEELPIVMNLCGLDSGGDEDCARHLIRLYDLEMVSVTRGGRGSLLVTGDEIFEHPGINVDVADTVGAGDAFSAALAHHYLRGASLERISEAANRLGAWAATQVGGMPPVDKSVLTEII